MPTTTKKPKKTTKTSKKEKTMTKHPRHSHVSETSNEKESTMPKTNHIEAASDAPATPSKTAPAAAAPVPTPSPAPAAPAATTAKFLAPPPAPNPAFTPPMGFVPDNSMDFRGVLPRTPELIALPIAVADLGKFADYATVMGSKAPSLAQVEVAFGITNDWSSARTAADAWDKYARTQEGVAWSLLRPLLARIGPSFLIAVESDPSLSATYPGLTTLLDVKKIIAKRGVATKKANKKALSEGKPATHGKVGKKSTKTAQKVALAEKEAAQVAPTPATTTSAPATTAPAPAASAGTAPAAAQPVTVTVNQTVPANGVQSPSNGVATTGAIAPSLGAPSGSLNGSGSSH